MIYVRNKKKKISTVTCYKVNNATNHQGRYSMKFNKPLLLSFFAFGLLASQVGFAGTPAKISGFLTTGVAYSDNEIPYLRGGITDDQPNYEQDTVLGVQLDSNLDPETRFSAQFIASNKEGTGFDTNAEWLYVARNFGNHATARIGRLRLPAFMYSQQIFVGGSYLWLRPPQEVYNLLVSVTNFTGGDISFNFDNDLGSTSFQLYTGQVNDKDIDIIGIPTTISTDQLLGALARFNSENLALHLSYSRLDSVIAAAGPIPFPVKSDLSIGTFGLNYNLGDLEIISEYAQTFDTDLETDSWYTTLAYHVGSWTPYITLAQADSSFDVNSDFGVLLTSFSVPQQGILLDSESITLGVRKELSPKVSVNAELHSGEAKHDTKGLFIQPLTPSDDTEVTMLSFAINVLF